MRRNGVDVWKRYQCVQVFKQDHHSTIGGINYAHVVAQYLYGSSMAYWCKVIVFSFFFSGQITVTRQGRDLLNFYSYRYKERDDYNYIAARLVEIAGDRGDAAECSEVFSLAQVWFTLRKLRLSWASTRGYHAGFLQRISATVLIAKFWSTSGRLPPELLQGRKCVVTFCDAGPYDNLVAQIAKLSGVRTLTAQHGQYRVLDETNISIDAEAYANFISDRLLCWGEATCAEFVRFGIDRRRLYTVGWIRPWDPIFRSDEPTGTFGVMLNGENGAESNLELIRAANAVADELNLRYVVRLHPSYTPAIYRSLVSSACKSVRVIPMAEYVRTVDFSIAHMSGATVEMLQVDSPVYALDDGRLADAFKPAGLSFRGIDNLVSAIRADQLDGNWCRNRTRELKKWFNDDTEQESRILTAMFTQEL